MVKILVILAGGASSRMKRSAESDSGNWSHALKEQAKNRSKGLISIGRQGRTLIDLLMVNAAKAGYKRVIIVTGENDEPFRERYGDPSKNKSRFELQIDLAKQYLPSDREKPLGTADAVLQAMEQFPELQTTGFGVCNCDNLYSVRALRFIRESSALNALIGYDREGLNFETEKIARFALLKFNNKGYLRDMIEKPNPNQVEAFTAKDGKLRVSMNLFKLDGSIIYEYLKNTPLHPERNEKELPQTLLKLIEDIPDAVLGILLSEHVPDLTSLDDLDNLYPFINEEPT